MGRYIDYDLIKQYPNKYQLTPKSIKKLKILDWNRLKQETWYNKAMTSGNWYCHLEGCNLSGRYDDESSFWIGFNKNNNKIDCHFSCYDGMCRYSFDNFYQMKDIENRLDMNVQVNAIRWLNQMIDEKILGL